MKPSYMWGIWTNRDDRTIFQKWPLIIQILLMEVCRPSENKF